MKINGGKVLFLDRSDISMHEIIAPEYVTETNRQSLKSRLFEKLELDSFNLFTDLLGKKVIVTRSNFACSSAEPQIHQIPCILEANGFNIVVAQSFSADFRSLLFNCGIFGAELDKRSIEDIFKTFSDKETDCSVVINDDFSAKVKIVSGSLSKSYPFSLTENEKSQILNKNWKGSIL